MTKLKRFGPALCPHDKPANWGDSTRFDGYSSISPRPLPPNGAMNNKPASRKTGRGGTGASAS